MPSDLFIARTSGSYASLLIARTHSPKFRNERACHASESAHIGFPYASDQI